jgi:naphthoate synthase
MITSDVASMSAARDPSPTAAPTPNRDGFELISRTPITWDVDLTQQFQFQDIVYRKSSLDQAAAILFNRPEILNAFRPTTIREIQTALEDASDDPAVAVILLTSVSKPDLYTPAFCAGGDQTVRGDGGYQDGTEVAPKLRVLELQQQMRYCPKPIVAVVRGYAVGGGHILHLVADLTLASENAVFGQTGPRMGSFDAGYGCTQAVACMGQKRARELWFLSKFYSAREAHQMGMVNAVYPDDELDGRVAQWTRRMVMNSPTALAACKASCNAVNDGGAGIMQMGGQLTRLFYLTEESKEGRQAFLEKRAPKFRSKL